MKFCPLNGWVAITLKGAMFCIASLALAGCGKVSSSPSSSPAAPSPATSPPSTFQTGSQSLAEAKLPPMPASEVKIWSQLRQEKGYVILLRHALAPGTGDPANFRLGDCSTQRNLSVEGRQQAIRIGEVLRQQKVPVSRVLSSQWCRCLETAQLLNVGKVEPFPVLNSFFQDRSTEQSQTEQLRQFILNNRDRAGVIILVTHQVNITAISTIVPDSGAAVVMRASAPNQVTFVGQLNPK